MSIYENSKVVSYAEDTCITSIEEKDYSVDYYIYSSALVAYFIAIWGSMEFAFVSEFDYLPFQNRFIWIIDAATHWSLCAHPSYLIACNNLVHSCLLLSRLC